MSEPIAPATIAVLHLEDEPEDSRLISSTLVADGLPCEFVRVNDEPGFRAAIARGGFDIILADRSLPTFDGLSALGIARELCPDVPFICVSGFPGEELAIEALKNGAADYVLKQRLSRLGPAVRRALQEYRERATRRTADAEARTLEPQLRHSQKLEAVGQLAGGIAHDFNNLLTVINGYCERLLASVGEHAPMREDLDRIHNAGRRAATLTRQLLAFSRRQVLQPRVIELNTVVQGIDQMLRRVIGEQITMVTDLDPLLGATCADPAQIEQVIMNLAINARDAMPQGGILRIETSNIDVADAGAAPYGLKAGRYVSLLVGDTGHGMDEETLSHMFEPFFTTNELGKGTGLGLPTVYGIVMQSGGEVAVESTRGHGTTMRVFLPRVPPTLDHTVLPGQASTVARGTETLLLVEDEALVRELVREFLESAGYTVLDAPDAEAALLLAEANKHVIDLLVTDVILPRMNGADLSARVAALIPGMKTVFVSGYPGDAVFRDGSFDPRGTFLTKPFTRQVLTQKVREILDETPRAGVSVMVIDDDADIRRLLGHILRTAGYLVVETGSPSGVEGSDAARIDVVLADVVANPRSRLVLQRMRLEHPEAHIVLMAGAFGDRLLRDATELGMHATLQKPLNEQSVLAAVNDALKG